MAKKKIVRSVIVIVLAVVAAILTFGAVLTLGENAGFIQPTTTAAPTTTTEAPTTTEPPPPHITSTATIRSAGVFSIFIISLYLCFNSNNVISGIAPIRALKTACPRPRLT